ncbi:MAG: nucleotidyltransferase family protein [Alphaproteobacteria bacterium]|nr:nucleotidyltransferase family protein [Alphaproteobacteria bacterium]
MLLSGLKKRASWVPDTAMVLAAGRGTRLAPLTDTTPKPLLRVGGAAILDRILDKLVAVGVERTVVNARHLADRIEDHLAGRTTPGITVLREDAVLETGGGVRNALPALGDRPFFVINGDSVWLDGLRDSLDRFAEVWDDEAMDILLLLYPFARVLGWHGYGDYTMDPLGRLTRRREGRVAPYAYMGVSIIHPRVFGPTSDGSAPEGAFSLNRLYDRAEEAGRLHGALHDGLWYHISTPPDLERANQRFATGHMPDVPFF